MDGRRSARDGLLVAVGPLVILVTSCQPAERPLLQPPADVERFSVLVIDDRAEPPVRATPLFPHDAIAPADYETGGSTVIVLGWRRDQLDPLSADYSRLPAENLREAASCEQTLPAPTWTHAVHGALPDPLPALTAPWLTESCEPESGFAIDFKCATCDPAIRRNSACNFDVDGSDCGLPPFNVTLHRAGGLCVQRTVGCEVGPSTTPLERTASRITTLHCARVPESCEIELHRFEGPPIPPIDTAVASVPGRIPAQPIHTPRPDAPFGQARHGHVHDAALLADRLVVITTSKSVDRAGFRDGVACDRMKPQTEILFFDPDTLDFRSRRPSPVPCLSLILPDVNGSGFIGVHGLSDETALGSTLAVARFDAEGNLLEDRRLGPYVESPLTGLWPAFIEAVDEVTAMLAVRVATTNAGRPSEWSELLVRLDRRTLAQIGGEIELPMISLDAFAPMPSATAITDGVGERFMILRLDGAVQMDVALTNAVEANPFLSAIAPLEGGALYGVAVQGRHRGLLELRDGSLGRRATSYEDRMSPGAVAPWPEDPTLLFVAGSGRTSAESLTIETRIAFFDPAAWRFLPGARPLLDAGGHPLLGPPKWIRHGRPGELFLILAWSAAVVRVRSAR